MKAGRTGIASTFTSRPIPKRHRNNVLKAQKKHNLQSNVFAKILQSQLKDGTVELKVRSNINNKDQIFYIRFLEALLNNTSLNERIPKDHLSQVEVRLDSPNEFKTLKTLNRSLNKTSLGVRSKAILALIVENVIDEYRGASPLKKLHQA